MNWNVPRKADGRIDFTPKRHHGFSFLVMLCGFLLPPLAVAVRFGIGRDFFINCFCTLCGYFPGHGHNFFIQNIRNNENQARTPKWAKRYGLVSDDNDKALKAQRAWVGRYNEQSSTRQMYDDDGNVYTYDRSHRFEDGDQARNPAAARRQASSSHDSSSEQFYNRTGNESADQLSLRRSKSKSSLRSLSRRSAPEDGMLPGAAEAERRRAKSGKGLSLPSFASRKGKADRHARSERVMHDADYVQQGRSPYDDASFDNIDGAGSGGARDVYGHRSSFDGPENADDNVGKRYARNGNSSAYEYSAASNRDPLLNVKVTPSGARQSGPVVDIMSDNHQF